MKINRYTNRNKNRQCITQTNKMTTAKNANTIAINGSPNTAARSINYPGRQRIASAATASAYTLGQIMKTSYPR